MWLGGGGETGSGRGSSSGSGGGRVTGWVVGASEQTPVDIKVVVVRARYELEKRRYIGIVDSGSGGGYG